MVVHGCQQTHIRRSASRTTSLAEVSRPEATFDRCVAGSHSARDIDTIFGADE